MVIFLLSFAVCFRYFPSFVSCFLFCFRAVLSTGDTSSPRPTCKPTPSRRPKKDRTDTRGAARAAGVASTAAAAVATAAHSVAPRVKLNSVQNRQLFFRWLAQPSALRCTLRY